MTRSPTAAGGRAKYKVGDYDGVVADCARAIKLTPDFAVNYLYRGLAKYELGDYEDAIADCNRALALNPGECGRLRQPRARQVQIGRL